jgi:hypothetical protein
MLSPAKAAEAFIRQFHLSCLGLGTLKRGPKMSMLNSRLGSCSRKEGGATLSFCNLLVWRKPKLQWQDVQERLGSVELRITSNAEPQRGQKAGFITTVEYQSCGNRLHAPFRLFDTAA